MTRDGLDRSGFALAGVILALALLTAVAMLSTAVARSQVVSAGAALDVASARAVAESAVEASLEGMGGLSPIPPGTFRYSVRSGVLGDRPWTVSAYRTGPELHVFVGESPFLSGGLRFRTGRLVWWLDPVARVEAFRGVVEGGGATLDVSAVVPPLDPLDAVGAHPPCHGVPGLAQAFPGPLPASAPLPGPPEWGGEGSESLSPVRLGRLDLGALLELADVVVERHAVLTGCPTCWLGLVVVRNGGSLSGSGSGVLVAEGSVRLDAAATWDGLIVAGGSVALGPGARFTGLARSGGDWLADQSAVVLGSVCAAYRSVTAAISLHRPIRFPGSSSLGALPPAGG